MVGMPHATVHGMNTTLAPYAEQVESYDETDRWEHEPVAPPAGHEVDEATFDSIRRRAVDEHTRYLAQFGAQLSYEDAAEIGDSGMQWLRDRLGLRVDTTDTEVIRLYPAD